MEQITALANFLFSRNTIYLLKDGKLNSVVIEYIDTGYNGQGIGINVTTNVIANIAHMQVAIDIKEVP